MITITIPFQIKGWIMLDDGQTPIYVYPISSPIDLALMNINDAQCLHLA